MGKCLRKCHKNYFVPNTGCCTVTMSNSLRKSGSFNLRNSEIILVCLYQGKKSVDLKSTLSSLDIELLTQKSYQVWSYLRFKRCGKVWKKTVLPNSL